MAISSLLQNFQIREAFHSYFNIHHSLTLLPRISRCFMQVIGLKMYSFLKDLKDKRISSLYDLPENSHQNFSCKNYCRIYRLFRSFVQPFAHAPIRNSYHLDFFQELPEMLKNLEKAFEEENLTFSTQLWPLATPQYLELEYWECESLGNKLVMEDTSFVYEDEEHLLCGIFDGHLGSTASALGLLSFPQMFLSKRKKGVSIKDSFHSAFSALHQEILETQSGSGTTAGIAYLDRTTNIIYVASLGTNLISCYSKDQYHQITRVPLSFACNWNRQEEHKRIQEIVKAEPSYPPPSFTLWGNSSKPYLNHFINVARALGHNNPFLSQEPEITAFQVKQDSLILLASNGLANQCNLNAFQEDVIVRLWNLPEDIPETACGYPLHLQDDISVIVIQAKTVSPADSIMGGDKSMARIFSHY